MSEFFQQGPELKNQFDDDELLRSCLRRILPEHVYHEVETDLKRFGQRVVSDILALAEHVESNEPVLETFDPWGRRVDKVTVSRAWQELDKVSAEEGLVAIGYERKYGEHSRTVQMAKKYLFHPSSAYYSCPLAMTDGAAKLIETYGDTFLKDRAFKRLTSRDPNIFWTSGQWMTEKTGGSDVSRSETVARSDNGAWRLYGTKWFTSAVTAQMAMTLARIEDEKGETVAGNRGLSLFYLELRNEDGEYNELEILRLKDKLGTRGLPTAELELKGSRARLVGRPGAGVRSIATLFNITRIDNSTAAISSSRRLLALARDYAGKREAFGRKLRDLPLHVDTLAKMEVRFQGAFHLGFYVSRLLGRTECPGSDIDSAQAQALLRLLTPVSKLYTAKQNLAITSELVESFGGAGYCEDTGLPKWLRDAQTLAIWEGTTNVLSMDTLRAVFKEKCFSAYEADVRQRLGRLSGSPFDALKEPVQRSLDHLVELTEEMSGAVPELVEVCARSYAYSLARVMIAGLLLEHAHFYRDEASGQKWLMVAHRWCEKTLSPVTIPDREHIKMNQAILF